VWIISGKKASEINPKNIKSDYTPCPEKKHPGHFWLQLKKELSDFNNFWQEYFWHNRPSNDHLISHRTQCLLLHYKILYFCPREHYYLIKIWHKTLFYIPVTWTDSLSNCSFYNCLQ